MDQDGNSSPFSTILNFPLESISNIGLLVINIVILIEINGNSGMLIRNVQWPLSGLSSV